VAVYIETVAQANRLVRTGQIRYTPELKRLVLRAVDREIAERTAPTAPSPPPSTPQPIKHPTP